MPGDKEQERADKRLVEAHLQAFNIPFRDMQGPTEYKRAGQKLPSGPDVKVTLCRQKDCRVGIEVTEYQCDCGKKGGSIKRHTRGCWDKTIKPAIEEARKRKPFDVPGFHATVSLKEDCLPGKDRAKGVGEEIVECVRTRVPPTRDDSRYIPKKRLQPSQPSEFDEFPSLQKHVRFIIVSQNGCPRGTAYWTLSGAGAMGLVIPLLLHRLEEKSSAVHDYDLDDVDETWLLICASGFTGADRAGRLELCEHEFRSEGVMDAARDAGFDRVIFWDRIDQWEFPLWPPPR